MAEDLDDLATDTLEQISGIAAFIGTGERQMAYLLEKRLLPGVLGTAIGISLTV